MFDTLINTILKAVGLQSQETPDESLTNFVRQTLKDTQSYEFDEKYKQATSDEEKAEVMDRWEKAFRERQNRVYHHER